MFGFNFGKNIFIGIDIGTSSIKMVEVKVSGNKPVLSNYAWMKLPEISGKDDFNSAYFETILPQYLKKMIKAAGFKGKNACVSIPAFGGLIALIDFPQMAEKEMEQAIRFEAHKYIPTSLDEVSFSWDIVGKRPKPNSGSMSLENLEPSVGQAPAGEKVQVLLVAASKNKVERYEKIIKNIGLNLKNIEIESFSLVTSLVGNDPGNFIIIDIGSRVCNILLVEKGIIKANRNIDAGGKEMTRIMAKSMGVDEEKAERVKISGKNLFSSESSLNFPSLEAIAGEASRMINSYFKNQPEKIDSIILSGGAASMTGIDEYFSSALKIKTISGNPFSRVSYNPKLEPVIGKISSQFSVSIGLALRGATDYLNKKSK